MAAADLSGVVQAPMSSDPSHHHFPEGWVETLSDGGAIEAFQHWAKLHPEVTAAEFQGVSLTYRALDEKSSRLAHFLITQGVKTGTPVAICVQPSFDILVGLLAILKAGATYLPIDPTHPAAIISTILSEAVPPWILTQSTLREVTRATAAEQFCFDTDWEKLSSLPDPPVFEPVPSSAAAYLIYTSGTTGKPKGVAATHENLNHYLTAARNHYKFTSSDSFCSLARYTFSISLFELLSPLTCGGKVTLLTRDHILATDQLARILEGITVLHAGPSLLGNLFQYFEATGPRIYPKMRHASSGGDLVPPQIMQEMKRVFPAAELYVIYGCTEISCMGTTYRIEHDRTEQKTLVGKPFIDVRLRVETAEGEPVPLGTVGEICFAGKGVVPGYLKRPELNQEKFVDREGSRFYQTGDLGRLDEEGNLEILGRRDFQVQIRGIRIELVGIESAVRSLGLAAQCAVSVKKIDQQDDRLICFVVQPKETDLGRFRRVLAEQLPDYMLPQALVVLDALPTTHNGKLDRRGLQKLAEETREFSPPVRTAQALPRNALEQQIALAFSKSLGISPIGIDDNFFDLGGHSLLAVTLMQSLEDFLGIKVSAGVVFEHATVRTLAEHLSSDLPKAPRPILLSRTDHHPRLFMLAGVHLYRHLAQRLEGKYSVYGVYAANELTMFESGDQALSVPQLAEEYVALIRREQPKGPYRIGGMSFGGVVAYEAARQLRASGDEVRFVGILDAVLPEQGWRRHRARLGRLLKLPVPQIVAQGRSQLTRAWDRLKQRGLKAPGTPGNTAPPEFIKYGEDAQLRPLEERRQEAYRKASFAYLDELESQTSRLTLIVAGGRIKADPMEDAACGWAGRVPDLDIHTIDCEHLDLVEEPFIKTVAEVFQRGMEFGDKVTPLRPSTVQLVPKAGPATHGQRANSIN